MDPKSYSIELDAYLDEMLQKIPSTAEILFFWHQKTNINNQWINWAVEVLEAGYDTEHLVILTGMSVDSNYFEFAEIRDKAFAELHINNVDSKCIFMKYSEYLVKKAIQNPDDLYNFLKKLMQLYIDTNCFGYTFSDFYYLYFSWDDLDTMGDHYHWPDPSLTKENRKSYVLEYFEYWLNIPAEERYSINVHDFSLYRYRNITAADISKKKSFFSIKRLINKWINR